jgi:uncharacterized protein (TIGR03437 family)
MSALVIAAGPERIEVVVPDGLSTATLARLVVSDGSLASEPLEVPIVPAAPVIYRNAIFNQDNVPNTITSPEQVGNVLQVFLTGLPLPQAGRIVVKIQGETQTIAINDVPYAGAAPGFAGVQQVNLRLPQQMPAGLTQLLVCGVANATGAEACAPGVRIYTR